MFMFLYPFFALAAQSPGRQSAFRNAVFGHLLLVLGLAWNIQHGGSQAQPDLAGQLLLIAGIVEGAILIGWRLTQVPRSQALEFLLVSPLRPRFVFLAEASVGLVRLALVTLSGLPILLVLCARGTVDLETQTPLPPFFQLFDIIPLMLMPFTWGAITGLALTTWAYEPRSVRRWVERLMLCCILVYLVIGVAAGENLYLWLARLPQGLRIWLWDLYRGFHLYNPFGVMKYWFDHFGHSQGETEFAWEQFAWLQLGSFVLIGLLIGRASGRLKAHFHERHYSPQFDERRNLRDLVGDRPLSWWAVHRVTEYGGMVNLWLAGGYGVVYSIYTVAQPLGYWPPWLGQQAFLIFEQAGGIPGLAAALVVLGAVPAAFQYGLWDSNAQDRCRRLELLLLTQLDAIDYWQAATAAAWKRGRGYLWVALLLWTSAGLAGKANVLQLATSAAAAAILWGLYFTLGFRAFARGMQANGLGVLLTVGVPLLTFGAFRMGWLALGAMLPPGSVFGPAAGLRPLYWLPGPLLGATVTLVLARRTLADCDHQLRRWYELHHGRKIME